VFAALLNERDCFRADSVAAKLVAHRFPVALTGSLAVEAQLRAHGWPSSRRSLQDLDFVVDNFATIPASVAGDFLLNHVHPFAAEGKTLLQAIDTGRAVRVDLFRAFGRTLSRSCRLGADFPFDVLAVEDLLARATAHVCAVLAGGRPLNRKHASTFQRLVGLGRRHVLEEAWRDHREGLPMSFDEATREAARLLDVRPELLADEEYSTVVTPCDRCCQYGSFRPSPPELIVGVLGYW
jgi:hypothetical protein